MKTNSIINTNDLKDETITKNNKSKAVNDVTIIKNYITSGSIKESNFVIVSIVIHILINRNHGE